jgi:hypothetical protein
MKPRFDPRRCARGLVSVTDDGTNTPAIALYNNAPGQQLVVLRNINAVYTVAAVHAFSFVTQGPIGSLAGTVAPFVAGDAAPVGALYANAGTTYTVHDTNWNELVFATPAWVHDFPFLALQPNQSFVLWTEHLPTQMMTVSLWWQVIDAEDLQFCFPEL